MCQITVIPMGVTAIKNPNKAFSMAMMGQKEARKYKESQSKYLPSPRSRK